MDAQLLEIQIARAAQDSVDGTSSGFWSAGSKTETWYAHQPFP